MHGGMGTSAAIWEISGKTQQCCVPRGRASLVSPPVCWKHLFPETFTAQLGKCHNNVLSSQMILLEDGSRRSPQQLPAISVGQQDPCGQGKNEGVGPPGFSGQEHYQFFTQRTFTEPAPSMGAVLCLA